MSPCCPGLMSSCCPATSQGDVGIHLQWGHQWGRMGSRTRGPCPQMGAKQLQHSQSSTDGCGPAGGTGAGTGWGDSAGHRDRDGRWNMPLPGSCPIAPPAAPFHIPSSQTPPSPGTKPAWPKCHPWLCGCNLGKGNQPPPGRRGATLVVLQHFLQRGFEHRTSPSWDLCPGGEVVLGTEGVRGSFWAAAPILEAQLQASGQECSGGMSSRDYVCYKKHQHLSPLLPKALRGGKRDLKSNLLHWRGAGTGAVGAAQHPHQPPSLSASSKIFPG